MARSVICICLQSVRGCPLIAPQMCALKFCSQTAGTMQKLRASRKGMDKGALKGLPLGTVREGTSDRAASLSVASLFMVD